MSGRAIAILIGGTVALWGIADPSWSDEIPEFRLDHFLVYKVAADPGSGATVGLRGQFDKDTVVGFVRGPVYFANPVIKNRGKINDETAHLNWYLLRERIEEPKRIVVIRNQFRKGEPQKLVIGQPEFLLVPTLKAHGDKKFPVSERLDHYKVYKVLSEEAVVEDVVLKDQFGGSENVTRKAVYFGVPVRKKHDDKVFEIKNERDHLTVYEIKPTKADVKIEVADQIGKNTLTVSSTVWLCVPSVKDSFTEE